MNNITLNDISPDDEAIIKSIQINDNMRRRLMDIGMIENTKVKCVGKSPMGDPKAFLIRGAVIAIRSDILKYIYVRKIH